MITSSTHRRSFAPWLRSWRALLAAGVVAVLVAMLAPAASAASGTTPKPHPRAATDPKDGCAATPKPASIHPPKSTSDPLTTDKLAELLRDGAIDFGEEESMSWILNLMGGGEATDGMKLDKIQDSINAANQKLDQISQQLTALCQRLEELAVEMQTLAFWNDFVTASQTAQTNVSNAENFITKIHVIENRTDPTTGKPRTSLLGDDIDTLAGLRTNLDSTAWIYGLRDSLEGSTGVIAAYRKVIENSMWHPGGSDQPVLPPSQTKFYTAQYMKPMSQLVDYYSQTMLQGLSAVADLFHADFIHGSTHYATDVDSVKTYLGVGLRAIDDWNEQAAGGLTSIPDNTMVDENTKPYTMWTQRPVSVTSDPKATSRCVDANVLCFDTDYSNDGQVLNSALLPTSSTSVRDDIKANGYAGLDDWRVPDIRDYAALTKTAPAGLASWAAQRGLEQFTPHTITSHLNGPDKQIAFTGPLLATREGKPGALASDDPKAGGLEFHAPAASPSNSPQAGGELVLARDAVPQLVCTDWCKSQQKTRPGSAKFAAVTRAARAPRGTAALNEPTTYNTPTTCRSGPTYTVAPDADAVQVTVVGGAGGAGKLDNKTNALGGRGGSVTTVVPVPAGTQLHVQVGQAGGDTTGGIGGGGQGGATKPADWPDTKKGDHSGGGGGASGVAADANCSLWLAVGAGGGGGGSGYHQGGITAGGSWSGGRGGDACPVPGATAQLTCVAAHSGSDTYPTNKLGTGGNNPPNNTGGHSRDCTAKGCTQVGEDGSNLRGGRGSDGNRSDAGGAGGGGGAGYYGGGGGGGGGTIAGGGGGGGGADFAIPGVVAARTSYGFGDTPSGRVVLTSIKLGQSAPAPVSRPAPSNHSKANAESVLADTGPRESTPWLIVIGLLTIALGALTLAVARRRRSSAKS